MKQKHKFKETEIGMIPEDWEVKSLGEVVTFQRGYDLPLDKFKDGKFPVIKSNGLAGYHVEFKAKGPGVLLGRSGKVGEPMYVKGDYWPHNTTLFSKEFHKCNPKFIYYFLRTLRLKNYNAGSAVPTLNRNHIHPILITVPHLPEQSAIASILSALDSKIELNQQMNKTLESIGQAIFKHWFVDFEFSNEQGKPYKSSGGEMIDSELGMIPKGWKVGKLGDYTSVERGLSYKGSGLCEEGTPMINLGNIAPNNHFKYDGLKFYSGDFKERNLVKPGDLIIANTDITQKREVLGSCLIVPSDLGSNKILFTHHIYAIRFLAGKESLSKHFLSYLFQTPEYRERAVGFATGTTVLALPEDAILNFDFVLPDKRLLREFDKLMTYVKGKSSNGIIESKNLSQVRDSLLPKLMSGKIRVPVEVKNG